MADKQPSRTQSRRAGDGAARAPTSAAGGSRPGARLPTEQELTTRPGRQPHRGARGGGRVARRRARGHPPRLGRLCRRSDGRSRSASSPPRATALDRHPRTSWNCGSRSRSRRRRWPPSAPAASRSPPSARPGGHRRGPAAAARARSPRISPFIAPSPKRPAIASSRASSPFSAAMSSRARACGSTVDTPAERRAYLERIQHEHARIVAGISDGGSGRGAAGDARPSHALARALSQSGRRKQEWPTLRTNHDASSSPARPAASAP